MRVWWMCMLVFASCVKSLVKEGKGVDRPGKLERKGGEGKGVRGKTVKQEQAERAGQRGAPGSLKQRGRGLAATASACPPARR